MRSTKIVATLGPATASTELMREMLHAGMNVARLNFSHGSHHDHLENIQLMRRLASEENRPLAILQDLAGPKLRIGEIPQGAVFLKPGSMVKLSARSEAASPERLPIPHCPWLPREVRAGQRVLLDDGSVELVAQTAKDAELVCQVVVGGFISSHKGINLPDTSIRELKLPTDQDREDLTLGLKEGVDYVALSFVRSGEDIRELRRLVQQAGAGARIIAKIEKKEALDNIDEIVDESDGVMVARGDLGVETDLEMVVLKQKEIIARCNHSGKLVITATQMLQSMIDNPTPTRAEVADVTNAILDGTDAVMLSGETAVGRYPVEAVRVMANIATKTEAVFDSDRYLRAPSIRQDSISAAVGRAACLLAKELSAAAIIANTESGYTARMVSRFRPPIPILGMSRHEATVRQLALVWGVYPFLIDEVSSTDELFEKASQICRQSGLTSRGDRVVITAGVPIGESGSTNLIKTEIL